MIYPKAESSKAPFELNFSLCILKVFLSILVCFRDIIILTINLKPSSNSNKKGDILIMNSKRKTHIDFIAIGLLCILLCLPLTGCSSRSDAVTKEDDPYMILSGKSALEGKGVVITLSDTEPKHLSPNVNPHDYLVADMDLIKMVEILHRYGAEVVSINNERILPTSTIDANDMKIAINGNEYGCTFIIKAIGNPDSLMEKLENEKSYVHALREYINVEIKKDDDIKIPPFKGNIEFEYAKPSN